MELKTTVKCEKCHGTGRIKSVDFKALRKVREDLNISLRQMALKIGITPPYLSDIERGNRRCPEAVQEAYERLTK